MFKKWLVFNKFFIMGAALIPIALPDDLHNLVHIKIRLPLTYYIIVILLSHGMHCRIYK
jgi:hypothetical protein